MAKQEVQLVIKGNELKQLEQLLDTCMHRDAKRIEQFLTMVGQKRQLEAQAEAQVSAKKEVPIPEPGINGSEEKAN